MSNSTITERALQEAFLDILSERPLSKITVKDITDRCGVNRNTFYYHFKDVPDLLERICQNEFDHVVMQYPSISSLDECIEAGMNIARMHEKAIYHIYYSSCRETYVTSLWRICEYITVNYNESAFPDAPISATDRALFGRVLKCTLFGLIVDWITSGMDDAYAKGLSRIVDLMDGVSSLIFQNAQSDGACEDM